MADALFLRHDRGFKPSRKSTLVFPYFAQWFVDGFLVGDRIDRRKNYSSHEVDLCQLYGVHPETTNLIRQGERGLLKSQQIGGSEFPRYLYDGDEIDSQFSRRRESTYADYAEIGQQPLFVERERNEWGPQLRDRHLRYVDGATGLPRYLLFNEIPREESLFDPEAPGPIDKQKLFAIANDRGNLTPGFVMMSTLMLREHNRIARRLSEEYKDWDDERLFQTTRNILTVILLRIVIEEYINHIAPYHFELFVDPPSFHKPRAWKWTNWMSLEFQLLYRWHPTIPDEIDFGSRHVPMRETLWNPQLVVQEGLANMFQYAAAQPAGRIGPRNTSAELIEMSEKVSLQTARENRIAPYNDYRVACGLRPVSSYWQITGDADVQYALKELYGSIGDIEFYAGLFCEDPRPNAAVGPLIGTMVAVDAFSQALTNPLLQPRIYNEQTFSALGMKILGEPQTIQSLLRRNSPELSSQDRRAISVSMTREDWARE